MLTAGFTDTHLMLMLQDTIKNVMLGVVKNFFSLLHLKSGQLSTIFSLMIFLSSPVNHLLAQTIPYDGDVSSLAAPAIQQLTVSAGKNKILRLPQKEVQLSAFVVPVAEKGKSAKNFFFSKVMCVQKFYPPLFKKNTQLF